MTSNQEIDAMLESIFGGSVSYGNSVHSHLCGLWEPGDAADAVMFAKEGPGCGHVWEHAREPFDPLETDEEHKARIIALHTCPACGKGPWTVILRPRTPEMAALFRTDIIGDTK